MLAGVQGIRIIISIVFITAFIVTIMVEKRDSGVNGDTVLLNKCVTPSKFGSILNGAVLPPGGCWGNCSFSFPS